jgi:hypothetical protein
MPNFLGYENVPLFSLTALDLLKNKIPTPTRINRTYDDERSAFAKGQFVNITRPGRPQVMDAPVPVGSIPDLVVDQVQVELAYYKEVKYAVPDRDLAYAPRFLQLHVMPAAYEMGNWIDREILRAGLDVPHFQDITVASATSSVLTTANKVLTENGVADDGQRHYAASPSVWQRWLDSQGFSNWQGAGQDGVDTQRTGGIGQKYSFYPYQTNNLPNVAAATAPVITTPTNFTGPRGATTITVAAATLTGTFRRGMVIQIGTQPATAGRDFNRQLYAVTADATAAGNSVTLQISPPLREAVVAQPFSLRPVRAGLAYTNELAFHKNALALVMAPLPEIQASAVASQVINDPESGLALRTRLWYEAQLSSHFFSIDCLFGIRLLDPDMAVRGAAA